MVERNLGRVESQSAETLWVTAITAALLFVGFRPQRFSGTGYPREARTVRQNLPGDWSPDGDASRRSHPTFLPPDGKIFFGGSTKISAMIASSPWPPV
jgi:hypothetical protein